METLFDRLFEVFSLEYMFTVIMASYAVISTVDYFNGERVIPTWLKRTITAIIGAVSVILFKLWTNVEISCLIASYFAAVFVYDTAIKFLLKKLDINYRK